MIWILILNNMIRYVIFGLWLVLVIGWNYIYNQATPFEDCFAAVCLSLWAKSLERNLIGD
jgi:hypothetical protein